MDDNTNSPGSASAAPHAPDTVDRENLYILHQAALRAAIYDQAPELPFWEADKVLELLSKRLNHFICDSSEELLILAELYVRQWARHQALVLELTTNPNNVAKIKSAIRRGLYDSVLDCSEDEEDLLSELRIYLIRNAWKFLPKKKDTAKTSTRLYSLAARHCFFRNSERKRDYDIVAKNVTTLGSRGAEFLSPQELASMRLDEQEGKRAERAENSLQNLLNR